MLVPAYFVLFEKLMNMGEVCVIYNSTKALYKENPHPSVAWEAIDRCGVEDIA
jgi:hypothetical protein